MCRKQGLTHQWHLPVRKASREWGFSLSITKSTFRWRKMQTAADSWSPCFTVPCSYLCRARSPYDASAHHIMPLVLKPVKKKKQGLGISASWAAWLLLHWLSSVGLPAFQSSDFPSFISFLPFPSQRAVISRTVSPSLRWLLKTLPGKVHHSQLHSTNTVQMGLHQAAPSQSRQEETTLVWVVLVSLFPLDGL